MGLIKAIGGAFGGVLADQWVDYIKCDALSMDVLAAKGHKFVGSRSSNTKGSENVITDGSRVDVAEGQCMLIVENGKVVDFSAEPGQYLYQTGTQPSMLSGGFKGLAKSFSEVGKRFTAGGQELATQQVYYINTKEIMGNKWGVGEVPFRDSEFQFSMKLSAYGEYSYHITDPLMFYANVCGNVTESFIRSKIDSQLKAELQSAMQPALGRVALRRIPYDQLPLFTTEICEELNKELTDSWSAKRGLSIVALGMASVKPDAESAAKIAEFQETRVHTDVNMAAARTVTARARAMENAASNEAGAMTGFLGMGFAQQAGNGAGVNELFEMGREQAEKKPDQTSGGWTCACGKTGNTGKFCSECGKPKPADGWTCSCGTVNKGRFCTECGKPKPAGELLYRCDKCGWEPEDPKNPPKYCPQCGDPFGDEDIRK